MIIVLVCQRPVLIYHIFMFVRTVPKTDGCTMSLFPCIKLRDSLRETRCAIDLNYVAVSLRESVLIGG
jgi:hypothetical protein